MSFFGRVNPHFFVQTWQLVRLLREMLVATGSCQKPKDPENSECEACKEEDYS